MRIVGQTADPLVSPDSGQISSFGVDNVPDFSVVCEFDAGNHDDTSVPGVKVVVADKRTFTGRAFALSQVGHSEPDVRRFVERSGIQHGNTVPA